MLLKNEKKEKMNNKNQRKERIETKDKTKEIRFSGLLNKF